MNSDDGVYSGSKAVIRKRIKAVRNAMDSDDRAKRSELICGRLSELPEYVNACNICAYVSKGNEVDTKLIIERAWADGKHVYVPKVYGQDMEFIEITDYGELATGNFGILEPVSDDFEEIKDGLMFMPGIAFDHSRSRIGFGGGYYDRYLAGHAGLVTVALAYEFQIVDKIDSEPTDIRPHIIVTESEVIS